MLLQSLSLQYLFLWICSLSKLQLSTGVDEPKSRYLPRKGGSENLCFAETDLGGAHVPLMETVCDKNYKRNLPLSVPNENIDCNDESID